MIFVFPIGIPPHIDTHSAFEDGILSLTLNSQVSPVISFTTIPSHVG